ncbi:major facilitator superfamily domain-containing protein [Mycena galericulata]|nr:major facilitator superfamily domain-containing protein [Mycena galericulata]
MATTTVVSDPTVQEGDAPGNAKAIRPPNMPESTILTGKRLALVFVSMLLSTALVALDQTILATALPRIASDFDSFSLQGWVATAFILAQSVFLLFYGQILRIFPAKWVLVSSIGIFETGSLVCGVSRNVDQLIAGRTVSGVGAAGIFIALMQVLSQTTRLEDRPRLFGFFGALFALSSIICARIRSVYGHTPSRRQWGI